MSEKKQSAQIRVQLGEYESSLVGIMATNEHMSIADMVNRCVRDGAPDHVKQYVDMVTKKSKPEAKKDAVEEFYNDIDKEVKEDEEEVPVMQALPKPPRINKDEWNLEESQKGAATVLNEERTPLSEKTKTSGEIPLGHLSEDDLRSKIDNEIPLEKDPYTIELINRYNAKGVSIREMARVLGRGRDTIARYLKSQA